MMQNKTIDSPSTQKEHGGTEDTPQAVEAQNHLNQSNHHARLRVYQGAFEAAMLVFELSQSFPRSETYSLTDQFRRSSRSVCANLAEAWRKRRYPALFASKLTDASSEAAECLVWSEFALRCGYLGSEEFEQLVNAYDLIIRQLERMIQEPEKWLLRR